MRVCKRACRMPSCWFRVQFPTSRLDFLNHQAFWASQRRDILLLRRAKTLQSDALRWVPIVIQLHWFLCFWFPSSFVQGCYRVKRLGGYSALRIARNLPEGGKLLSVEKDSLWVISHWVYLSLLPRSSGCEDELFAAIATKIIEFAGLDDKADRACKLQDKATRPRCFHTQVKIWMGTVHSEIANITNRP